MYKYVDKKAQLSYWPSTDQKVSRRMWIWRIHPGEEACKQGIHSGFKTQDICHQNSKTRVSVAPKKDWCPPKSVVILIRQNVSSKLLRMITFLSPWLFHRKSSKCCRYTIKKNFWLAYLSRYCSDIIQMRSCQQRHQEGKLFLLITTWM